MIIFNVINKKYNFQDSCSIEFVTIRWKLDNFPYVPYDVIKMEHPIPYGNREVENFPYGTSFPLWP